AVLELQTRLGGAREAVTASLIDLVQVRELLHHVGAALVWRHVVVAKLLQRFRDLLDHLGVGLHLLDRGLHERGKAPPSQSAGELTEVLLLQEGAGAFGALTGRAGAELSLTDFAARPPRALVRGLRRRTRRVLERASGRRGPEAARKRVA